MIKTTEKTILLTGYPPFGKHTINPSGMVAEALNGREFLGYRVQGVVLPCDYLEMPPLLAEWMQKLNPALVIGTGLAYGETGIRLERVGLNLLDFGTTPDNGGHRMNGQHALKGGPAAYFSTLPLEHIEQKLRKDNIPAYISNHAGCHLCNHMLYTASHLAQSSGKPLVGFVHLPALPNQVTEEAVRDGIRTCAASMSFETMTLALGTILKEAITHLES